MDNLEKFIYSSITDSVEELVKRSKNAWNPNKKLNSLISIIRTLGLNFSYRGCLNSLNPCKPLE